VNGSGLITGVGAGTTTITAASEGKSSTSTVTVSQGAVARVDVSPAILSLQAGQTQQLVASSKDAKGNVLSGKTAVWSSDNLAVASVNGGYVTTSKAGVATITASVEGVKGTATITVNPVTVATATVTVATVTVTAPSKKLKAGSTMQLTATAKDDKGSPVPNQSFSWSSSDTNTATVSGSGVVTGKRSGNVTITAQTSASGGKRGSLKIDVK